MSSYQARNLVILDTKTGCSSFSFFLGIFMFFLMFFFSSWVHGVSYRFQCPKDSISSFHHRITDLDVQPGILLRLLFPEKTSFKFKLNMYCFSWLLPWIYTSSSSMDHRISSLLILALCMSAYNRLPPSNRVHASVYILIVFCNI